MGVSLDTSQLMLFVVNIWKGQNHDLLKIFNQYALQLGNILNFKLYLNEYWTTVCNFQLAYRHQLVYLIYIACRCIINSS